MLPLYEHSVRNGMTIRPGRTANPTKLFLAPAVTLIRQRAILFLGIMVEEVKLGIQEQALWAEMQGICKLPAIDGRLEGVLHQCGVRRSGVVTQR